MAKNKLKVYISGAITNNPNYKEDFANAEKLLKKHGFEVVNPASLGEVDGWENSKGSRLEASLASWLTLKWVCCWGDDDFDIFSLKGTFGNV